MFDFVHEKKRLVQIVLAVIILPFAFWGVDSYNKSSNAVVEAANVNGSKITLQEFETALRQQQNNLRQMLGPNFDAKMLDNPEIKTAVLDNLVAQRLLVERAKAAGLTVTDDQVAQVIGSIEAFQENGSFDNKRYESALAEQSMSPLMFEARLRDDLLAQQVRGAYLQNGFASNAVADNLARLNEQRRLISVAYISLQPFMAQAKVDEAALKKYYESNPKKFQLQEQARVEYVKFSMPDLMAKVDVSAEDARKYYAEHQSDFGSAEQRQAAHILIAVPLAAAQAEQDVAKANAEKLLQQVRQAPDKFADLAKQHSQDPGSAGNGGDLGFFGRGMMVKQFDEAVFALKQGEISGLVRSDFGYHIVKLIAVRPSRALPFDEVRESIVNKLRQQKGGDKFAELAEAFSNTVYEQSDTLKPAAELVGADIMQSGWLASGMAGEEPWTEKMLQAIFSEDVLKHERNTAAIEVSPDTLVAARILEYKPATVRAFAEVRDTIHQELLRQQAIELAGKQGKAVLEQLQHGEQTALDWSKAQEITRAQHGDLDVDLVRQIFQANAAKLPGFVGAEAAQGGYLLVRIAAVKDGEKPDELKRSRYVQQLRQMTGEEMFRAYMADVRQQSTIKTNLPETVTDVEP